MKQMKSKYCNIIVRLLKGLLVFGFAGCTTIVAGKEASAYGSVLVGHNEDNGGRISTLYIVPEKEHRGKELLLLNGGGMLDQAERTWPFLWAETPGEKFCDFYLNSWGVTVTNNMAISKERDLSTVKETGEIVDGGIDYWLGRIICERCKSAREGLETAAYLIGKFGYNSNGRMYVIADHDEAWLFCVAAGRNYCFGRVPDDGVVVVPNTFILDEMDFDDHDNYIISPGLREHAVKMGYFEEKSGEKFIFSDVFGSNDRESSRWKGSILRRQMGQLLLTGKASDSEILPFSVKPAVPVTVEKMKQILRSHYEEIVFNMPEEHFKSPHHMGIETICRHDTMESIVVQLRKNMPRGMDAIMWRALRHPCSSIYIPFYMGIDHIPEGYNMMGPEEALLTHFNCDESFFDRMGNPWQAVTALQSMIESYHWQVMEKIRMEIRNFEEKMDMDRLEFEEEAVWEYKSYQESGNNMSAALKKRLTEFTDKAAGSVWHEIGRYKDMLINELKISPEMQKTEGGNVNWAGK